MNASEVVCRGMRFRDEDDAYDFFRQREIDDAAEVQRAFFAGKQARRDGATAGMNPYRSDHEVSAWGRGWSEVEAEISSARRRAA